MATKTKFGPHSNIAIPPESTGPDIQSVVRYELDISASAGGAPVKGDKVSGGTSLAIGTIIKARAGVTGTDFDISVSMDDDSPSLVWIDTESLSITGGKTAVLDASQIIHTNTTILVGGNSSFNVQNVDTKGAACVRFSEGELQFSAFGVARVSGASTVSEYQFHYNDEPGHFTDIVTGAGASIVHLPNEASVEYRVGTPSGEIVQRTTNLYHPYDSGVGQLVMMTVVSGDTGKTNVRRRWGYYDDENGVFFQLDGTTLSVVTRSFTSGAVVDTVVTQANWSTDRVDGTSTRTNASGFNLDVSTDNIYWIDLAWLGAGVVRFGIFDTDGTRITCHAFKHTNSLTVPWSTTAALPIRQEIENTGVSGSISSLKTTCIAVFQESEGEDLLSGSETTCHSWVSPAAVTAITTEKVIASFRPGLLFTGVTNRKLAMFLSLGLNVTGDSCIIRMYKGSTLGGVPVWTNAAGTTSPLEVDTAGTLTTPGILLDTKMAATGGSMIELSEAFLSVPNSFYLNADGTFGPVFTITAESVNAVATVRTIVNWIDLGH